MTLFWKIRYLDRTDKTFKDRSLFLDSEALPLAERTALELVLEMDSPRSRRDILKFRRHFQDEQPSDLKRANGASKYKCFCLPGYFEDETGAEIKQCDFWLYLTPDDAPKIEPQKPIPVAEVSLTENEIRLLGYFVRDHRELSESVLMKEGPGTISRTGAPTETEFRRSSFKTSLSDDEIRSFVTIYRRLYMNDEPANAQKAVELFQRAIGDHPYARFVAGFAELYRKQLDSPPQAQLFMPRTPYGFTTKRLIDVFLYTQYTHQPDEKRQRQFGECLAEVQGDRSLLTCLFLYELWTSSIHIGNAGRCIEQWFQHYCSHHRVTPDILNSLRHEDVGLGAFEKEEDRKARLFREKVEVLELELWKRAGRPE
jgi:hypothetical protein